MNLEHVIWNLEFEMGYLECDGWMGWMGEMDGIVRFGLWNCGIVS